MMLVGCPLPGRRHASGDVDALISEYSAAHGFGDSRTDIKCKATYMHRRCVTSGNAVNPA